ncbi:MAG: carboxypeptidase-like regulatory domain-containing protein [Myxococcota bacterium]|nr:carboxypeptidase-like regulatory domain-containing protein [Myxococcota bacterium]
MRSFFYGLLLGSTTLLSVGCGAGPISIRGRVIDVNGSPIQKAEIATQPETDVVVSNSRGFFVLRQRITELGETEQIKAGRYRVTVRKFGFEELQFAIRVKGGKNRIKDLVMRERKPEIEDTAPDESMEKKVQPGETSTPKQGV